MICWLNMTKKSKILLEWQIRAKKDETDCAHRRTWMTRCGKYATQESVGKFTGMGTVYYALRVLSCEYVIISRHRKRRSAMLACEKYENSLV